MGKLFQPSRNVVSAKCRIVGSVVTTNCRLIVVVVVVIVAVVVIVTVVVVAVVVVAVVVVAVVVVAVVVVVEFNCIGNNSSQP